MKNKPRQKGFSLVELLVVVVIIGIIAAFAIPSLLASRRTANESTTLANLRTLHTAEATYATTGASVYGSFANLTAANILDASWTGTPTKNFYTYTLTLGASNQSFCITATSIAISSGSRSFAISHQGVIYELAGTTAPNCNANNGIISTGIVVGS